MESNHDFPDLDENNEFIDLDSSDVQPPLQPENENMSSSQDKDKKRKRNLHSDVWKDFTIFGEPDSEGKEDMRCNHCDQKYHFNLHKNGTTTLKRHVLVCKKKPRYGDVGALMVNHEAKLKARKFDQNIFRELIAMAIIDFDLPYSFVENVRVRNAFKYANSEIRFWTRNTAAVDVYKFYEKEKRKLKTTLTEIPSRVCLTTDLWRAITIEGYICLTAHYIDNDWKLNSKVLSFCAFPPPHTGVHLSMKIIELLKEWGLEKKLFSLTVDNATSNDSMQTILKRQLQKDLLCNGEFFHVRCSAHILNLIVQDGLAIIGDALQKIRDSIRYVKASESREKMFKNCVETIGLKTKAGLAMDVATRWNSTYNMLDKAIIHRHALSHLQDIDMGYKHFPSDVEWKRGEMICEFLKPFQEMTNLISGSSYPTSNLYFMQVWQIESWLQLHQNSEDDVIRDMVGVMKKKFEKYWEEYSDILAIGAILDPRMKFTLFEYCFTTLSPSSCQQKLNHVRMKMYKLFEAYRSNSNLVSTTNPLQTHVETSLENAPKGYTDFYAFYSKKIGDHGKSPLDVYLDEPPLNMLDYPCLKVLDYWKENSIRFKELSYMACDILSIPITTVASESSFSIGSHVLNKYRSRLLPSNVQALICARNWLRGFEANDDVDDVLLETCENAPPFADSDI